PHPDHVEARRNLVKQVDSDLAWGWFSGFLARCGSWDESIAAAERAIELAPDNAAHYRELIDALYHAGRLEDALEAAGAAARRWPNLYYFPAASAKVRAKMESRPV